MTQITQITQEENRLRKIVQTGKVFKTIFNTPEFIEKIDELEQRYFNQFKSATDTEQAMSAWHNCQSLNTILSELNEPILLGEQAEQTLNQLIEMNDH